MDALGSTASKKMMNLSYNIGFPQVNNPPEREQSRKTKNADDCSLVKEIASWGHNQASERSWVFGLYEELRRKEREILEEVAREWGEEFRG